ncbi:MAG: c-type cytochrome [Gammaproteobacteria bacterium]
MPGIRSFAGGVAAMGFGAAVVAAALQISAANAGDGAGVAPPPDAKFYRVEGGKVDAATMRGWQVYHRTCYVCHGVDANGTDVAPSLVERVKNMSAVEFANLVLNRYRIVMPMDEATAEGSSAWREAMIEEMRRHERGESGELIMPAWEQSFRVRPHLMDVFGYLQARADGVLGTGEPELIQGE